MKQIQGPRRESNPRPSSCLLSTWTIYATACPHFFMIRVKCVLGCIGVGFWWWPAVLKHVKILLCVKFLHLLALVLANVVVICNKRSSAASWRATPWPVAKFCAGNYLTHRTFGKFEGSAKAVTNQTNKINKIIKDMRELLSHTPDSYIFLINWGLSTMRKLIKNSELFQYVAS
jgi:hypothetical protein